jgi:hypothetical protein
MGDARCKMQDAGCKMLDGKRRAPKLGRCANRQHNADNHARWVVCWMSCVKQCSGHDVAGHGRAVPHNQHCSGADPALLRTDPGCRHEMLNRTIRGPPWPHHYPPLPIHAITLPVHVLKPPRPGPRFACLSKTRLPAVKGAQPAAHVALKQEARAVIWCRQRAHSPVLYFYSLRRLADTSTPFTMPIIFR